MRRPWFTSSGWLWRFSLYVGVRWSHATGVTVVKSQASSVVSGRCDCTNTVHRSGSRPSARSAVAISRVRSRRTAGSCVLVRAW